MNRGGGGNVGRTRGLFATMLERADTKEAIGLNRSRLRSTRPVDVIRALALKQTGHAAEGEQLLKDWLAHDPKSETAKWGLEVLAGKPATAPADSMDPSLHILAASLP
jgi:hypothetical protein